MALKDPFKLDLQFRMLMLECPFLFTFQNRVKYLKVVSMLQVDVNRALCYLRGKKVGERYKVKVARESLLESAYNLTKV